jgi:hypothetical protein
MDARRLDEMADELLGATAAWLPRFASSLSDPALKG